MEGIEGAAADADSHIGMLEDRCLLGIVKLRQHAILPHEARQHARDRARLSDDGRDL
jgi:hypothetical protein